MVTGPNLQNEITMVVIHDEPGDDPIEDDNDDPAAESSEDDNISLHTNPDTKTMSHMQKSFRTSAINSKNIERGKVSIHTNKS